jgi:hypothetical protein
VRWAVNLYHWRLLQNGRSHVARTNDSFGAGLSAVAYSTLLSVVLLGKLALSFGLLAIARWDQSLMTSSVQWLPTPFTAKTLGGCSAPFSPSSLHCTFDTWTRVTVQRQICEPRRDSVNNDSDLAEPLLRRIRRDKMGDTTNGLQRLSILQFVPHFRCRAWWSMLVFCPWNNVTSGILLEISSKRLFLQKIVSCCFTINAA